MTEETKPIEAEVVSITPKPRFDLRQAKPDTYNETVTDVSQRTGLTRAIVEGVLADCIMQKATRETQAAIAARWGIPFGDVTRCRFMGKHTIDETRTMLGTKSIVLANKALDALADDMNDPAKLSEMKTKDKLAIAKGMTDNALNLENKGVGPVTNNTVNVGDVAILIANKADREKQGGGDAFARLLAKGVNPKLVEKAKGE